MADAIQLNKSGPLSFVTVVYGDELGLLQLQARSLARFLPKSEATEVLVILNDFDPHRLSQKIKAFGNAWGTHSDVVRFVSPDEIFQGSSGLKDWPKAFQFRAKSVSRRLRNHHVTNWGRANGWLIQQAMKLAVARVTKGENIVYLDAKNQFVAASNAEDFFTADGVARARLELMSGDSFAWHAAAYSFLGLTKLPSSTALPPAITPFCASKADVLDTLDQIENKAGAIEYFFKPKTRLGSEFTLLAAIQMQSGPLAPDLISFDTVFRGGDEQDVLRLVERVIAGELKMIGTHSGLLKELSREQLKPLHRLWVSLGLVRDIDEALQLTPSRSVEC